MRRVADEQNAPAMPGHGQDQADEPGVIDLPAIADLLSYLPDRPAVFGQHLLHQLREPLLGQSLRVRRVDDAEHVFQCVGHGDEAGLVVRSEEDGEHRIARAGYTGSPDTLAGVSRLW